MSEPQLSLRERLRARRRARRKGGAAGFFMEFVREVRRYIVTGLLLWIPLLVTIWVSWWVINSLGASINSGLESAIVHLRDAGSHMPMLGFLDKFQYEPWIGFLLIFLIFLSTGFLTRWIVAQRVIAAAELILTKIPFISSVYTSAQQIRDVFANQGLVQEVVLVQYPRPGCYCIGMITSRQQGIIQQTVGRQMQAVFMPLGPNPTSGFLIYVPTEEIIPLPISAEDAMKAVMSGGAFAPPRATSVRIKQRPDGRMEIESAPE